MPSTDPASPHYGHVMYEDGRCLTCDKGVRPIPAAPTPSEVREEATQAAKNIIEAWLRVHDLRGSPPPITWAHLSDLAEHIGELIVRFGRLGACLDEYCSCRRYHGPTTEEWR